MGLWRDRNGGYCFDDEIRKVRDLKMGRQLLSVFFLLMIGALGADAFYDERWNNLAGIVVVCAVALLANAMTDDPAAPWASPRKIRGWWE